eukprot:Skav217705  [mRNA]  locus=scaffold2294:123690:127711:- [translate_table: standard]
MSRKLSQKLSRKMSRRESSSHLTKTDAAGTGSVGNEAPKPQEPGAETSQSADNSPNRQRTLSILQIMAPSQLKPRQSVTETDDQKRKGVRTLGSTAAFEIHSMKDVIERVPLYNGCSGRFLEALAPMMHSRLVEPGTDLVVEGDAGDCMYILSRGDADLLKGGEVVDRVMDGAVFGDYSSISKNSALVTRPWTVRATSLCDVKMLARDDVLQVLSHFRDDANRLEKRVELHIQELQKKGAMPAKKEWWQIRRHSTASNTSVFSEKVKAEEPGGGLRSAVGRALTGIKLARRFSVGAPMTSTMSMGLPTFSGGSTGPSTHRRMSDSQLTAHRASILLAQRQNSKSSQAQRVTASGLEVAEDISLSVPVPGDSESEDAVRSAVAKRFVRNLLADGEEEIVDDLAHRGFSPITIAPSTSGTVKFGLDEELTPRESVHSATLVPSLPSIERSILVKDGDDGSPMQGGDDPHEMATIKLPQSRLRSLEEQRQRDVALHPFNQGGLCGFPVTRRAMELADLAALKVCRKAPVNGAAARHQTLTGQVRNGRVSCAMPTVASKSRNRNRTIARVANRADKVTTAPSAEASIRMTLWQEFQLKKMEGVVCSQC